jgi:hypothetical protein
MPNPYTTASSSEVVHNYILGMMNAVKVANGIVDVFYGDEKKLPHTPTVCVVPGPESTSYNGVGGRPVMKLFTTYVMVYYGKVQDHQVNVHASLTLANTLMNVIHADVTLGGNAIDCLVTNLDPGMAVKSGSLYDASRLTLRSRSKVVLNP